MKIRLIDREVIDGRPRLTIQTKRWWQWSWRTEVWLRSTGLKNGRHWWYQADGTERSDYFSGRLHRVESFAENEEKRTIQLIGAKVRDARTEPN